MASRCIELPLDAIKIEHRCRRHIGDIDSLIASIEELGLLQPIIVTDAGRLIAGERRIEAHHRLGRKSIMCCVVDDTAAAWPHLVAEFHENTCREPFRPSEAVAAAEHLLPMAAAAAWRRMAHWSTGAEAQIFSRPGEAVRQVAAHVGMSGPTLSKAIEVVEAARNSPEQYGDLVARMDQTGKVNGAYVDLRRRLKLAAADPDALPSTAPPGFSACIRADGRIVISHIRNRRCLGLDLHAIIARLETEFSRNTF